MVDETESTRDALNAALTEHIGLLASAPRNGRTNPQHHRRCLDYVAQQLADLGWAVDRQELRVRNALGIADNPNPVWPLAWHHNLTGTNIVATWGTAGPALVLIGHHDTVGRSPGADDNASSVAALLEAARIIAHSGTSRRIILGIVDLEETGHQGSRHLAGRLAAAEPVAAAIAFDAIGYYTTNPGSQQLPGLLRGLVVGTKPGRRPAGDFLAVVSRDSSAAIAAAWCCNAERYQLGTLQVRDPRNDGRRGVGTVARPWLLDLDRSDHASFQRLGIPAVLITDTANMRSRHYHRATDTPDTLDVERIAAAALATADLAIQPQP